MQRHKYSYGFPIHFLRTIIVNQSGLLYPNSWAAGMEEEGVGGKGE